MPVFSGRTARQTNPVRRCVHGRRGQDHL